MNFGRIAMLSLAGIFFVVSFALAQSSGTTPPKYVGPTVIEGQVVSQSSSRGEWPMSSDSGWGLNFTLYKLDAQTRDMLWVSSSACWRGQGCADRFGKFRFTEDYFGVPLEQADYRVVTTALGHFDGRTDFNLTPGGVKIEIALKMSPLYLEFLGLHNSLPTTGGPVCMDLRLWNLDSSALTVTATAMIYGPTITQSYGQYQVDLEKFAVPTERWEYLDTTRCVMFSGDLPDSDWYSVSLRVGPPSGVYSEVWTGLRKGGPGIYPSPTSVGQ